MAVGTMLSRGTGLIRTAALAGALGVTSLADAYNIANTVPTILLVLVTGGTLSAVLIPLLVEVDDGPARRQRADALGGLVLWVTVGAAALAAVGSPLIARLFGLGLRGEPSYEDFVRLATVFLLVFAPQVVAYGLSVHAVAVLNAAGRLALAGVAPVAANLVTIAAIAGYVAMTPSGAAPSVTAVLVLGGGTTAGVFVVAALQIAGARRVLPGLTPLPRLRRDAVTGRVLRLGRWTMLYVAANQVGLAVVLTVAASVSGGASAYQWAFAIMQLPFAVIAVSVLSALYPRISQAAQRDPQRFEELVARGLRALLFLLAPAALVLTLLASPIAQALLGHGAVDEAGQALIADAVRAFGLALLPFTVFQLLTRSCYARADTRSPALVNVAVNAVNIAGAVAALTLTGQAPGRRITILVLAYAASYTVGCVLLTARLRKQCPGLVEGSGRLFVRLLPTLLVTAAVMWGAASAARSLPTTGGTERALLEILAGLAAGALVYGLGAFVLAPAALRSVVGGRGREPVAEG